MRVNWTKTAEYTFNDELDYIFLKWGKNGVHDFVELVEGHVSILKSGILPGVKLESLDAFKWVLSKQTSLIYAVREKELDLLLFWNNQRNPIDLMRYLKTT